VRDFEPAGNDFEGPENMPEDGIAADALLHLDGRI